MCLDDKAFNHSKITIRARLHFRFEEVTLVMFKSTYLADISAHADDRYQRTRHIG